MEPAYVLIRCVNLDHFIANSIQAFVNFTKIAGCIN